MLTKNHALLEAEVKAHVAADAIIAGHYWNEEEQTGCFIGCLTHSSSATEVTDKFGLPLTLVKIAENIFESLPAEKGKSFFAALPGAVGHDGKDLSLVHWKFLASELRSLPAMPSHIQDVIDPVISGMDLLASGGEWPAAGAADAYRAADRAVYATADAAARAAADAAADAARSAADADAAARAPADAAADAADATAYATTDATTDAAARDRQAALLLQLISNA